MDFQKELNEWADWFIPHDSKDLRDALELNSFNQLNVEKLLAINGLSEAYAFRAKDSWEAWQAAKAHEAEKLKGCVVVPVELSESIAEKLALEKVEKPRQENDVVWQEIADRSYKDHLIQKKWEIIRNYKELVEAVRGGNE